MADIDTAWIGRMREFMHSLTQAVAKVPQCCLVASLLASDVNKMDDLEADQQGAVRRVQARSRRRHPASRKSGRAGNPAAADAEAGKLHRQVAVAEPGDGDLERYSGH